MKNILIILAVVLLAGAIASPAMLTMAKHYRANQLWLAAVQAKDANDEVAAYDKLVAAFNLDPAHEEVLRHLGPYGADIGHRMALQLWLNAANAGLLERESLIRMIQYGQQQQRFDLVEPFLQRELSRSADDPVLLEAQLLSLLHQMKQVEAFAVSRRLARLGSSSDAVRSSYLFLAFSMPRMSVADREESFAFLKSFATEADNSGLIALRILNDSRDQLSADEQRRYATELFDHPQADLLDQLNCLQVGRIAPATEDALIAKALQLHQNHGSNLIFRAADDAGLHPDHVLADWFNSIGLYSACLRFLERRESLATAPLEYARVRASIGLKDFAAAQDFIIAAQHLSQLQKSFLRLLIHENTGAIEEAQSLLKLMVEIVTTAEVNWMEAILLQRNKPDLLLAMYEKLAATIADPFPAQMKLLEYYYQLGHSRLLAQLIPRIDMSKLEFFPSGKVRLLYFMLLFNHDRERAAAELERMVARFPQVLDFRILLAFAYSLKGNTDIGAALLQDTPAELFPVDPSLMVAAAAVLLTADDAGIAQVLRSRAQAYPLLPMERNLLGKTPLTAAGSSTR